MAAANAEVGDNNFKIIKNYSFPVQEVPRFPCSSKEAINRIDAGVNTFFICLY